MAFFLVFVAAMAILSAIAILSKAGQSRYRQGAFAGAAVLFLIGVAAILGTAIRIVPPGHVAVATLFGAVQEGVFEEGLHVVNPFYQFQQFSTRRTMFDFRGSEDRNNNRLGSAGFEIISVSADSTPLRIDIGFPLRLNGPISWKMFQRIGSQRVVARPLIIPAARSAVPDAVAGLGWRNAATAAALIYETKALLIGEAADPAVAATVRQVIAERPEILTINEVLTMHLGPRDILVNIGIDFRDDLDAAGVERSITEMERLIKEASPEVKRIFVEAQAWHASRRMATEAKQRP